MILLEHEAKQILIQYGLIVPVGRLFEDPTALSSVAARIEYPVMVKAQVLAGGRGKSGLVARCDDQEALMSAVTRMSASSWQVFGLLLEPVVNFDQEWYVAIRIDDVAGRPSLLISASGGIEIEDRAEEGDVVTYSELLDPLEALSEERVSAALRSVAWPTSTLETGIEFVTRLYRIFQELDAELIEINPLVVSPNGYPVALDAKIVLDDAALHRHGRYEELASREISDPLQRRARESNLMYVDLDGDIGVLSMGAGITMALMDTLQYYGGMPANFLDSTGGIGPTTSEAMAKILVAKAQRSHLRALVVSACLTATSVRDVVEGLVIGLESAPSGLPVFASIQASAASVEDSPLEDVLRTLRSVGVTVCSSMDDAARHAASLAKGGQRC
jgi:succinyl-CoA synthetase beta subunit